MKKERATPEQRREIKNLVIAAVTSKEFPAVDVGEVLVSIGAAMMKGSNVSETEYTAYAKKTWAAQQSIGASSN